MFQFLSYYVSVAKIVSGVNLQRPMRRLHFLSFFVGDVISKCVNKRGITFQMF